jgi:cysteine desulfurase
MEKRPDTFIYLDHNATTPVERTAAARMKQYMTEEFGNPSSPYSLGMSAKQGVEGARSEVASLLGCKSHEIVFTSGGTESNNMVLKGVIDFRNPGRHHIITSAIEHPAIMNTASYLMELGVDVTFLPVDKFGRVDASDVEKAIKPYTSLISIMLANNETGTIQPLEEISEIAEKNGIPLHTDAAQAVGKIRIDVCRLGVDFLSVAGHKLYAPKGVGALYVRNRQSIRPLIHGAGQEGGKRAGTENVILIAGLGAACRTAETRLDSDIQDMTYLRDRLQEKLFRGIDGLVLNGHPYERLPNTLNISIPNIKGDKILEGLPSICASTGAACHDRTVKLSHVLAAMSVSPETGMGTLRLSVGRTNNQEQIDKAAELIIRKVDELRAG